jgi:hypothetical protein
MEVEPGVDHAGGFPGPEGGDNTVPEAPAGALVGLADAPVAPVGAPVGLAGAGAVGEHVGAPVAPVGAPVGLAGAGAVGEHVGAPVAPVGAPVAPVGAPVAPVGAAGAGAGAVGGGAVNPADVDGGFVSMSYRPRYNRNQNFDPLESSMSAVISAGTVESCFMGLQYIREALRSSDYRELSPDDNKIYSISSLGSALTLLVVFIAVTRFQKSLEVGIIVYCLLCASIILCITGLCLELFTKNLVATYNKEVVSIDQINIPLMEVYTDWKNSNTPTRIAKAQAEAICFGVQDSVARMKLMDEKRRSYIVFHLLTRVSIAISVLMFAAAQTVVSASTSMTP